jgi:chromosome segregation ATPase
LITYYQKDLSNNINQIETKRSKIYAAILKVKNDISSARSKTDTDVKEKTNKIATTKAGIEAKNNQIENLQTRIKDVQSEIVRITKNTDFLIEERNKLLASEKKENNILSSVIYINTIQQNIAHSNNLKNEVNNLNDRIIRDDADIEKLENDILDLEVQKENLTKQTKYKIATLQSKIKDLESQNKYASEEIQILEFKKDSVQNIQILKPPTNDPKHMIGIKDRFKALGKN